MQSFPCCHNPTRLVGGENEPIKVGRLKGQKVWMNVAITGSTGLVGTEVSRSLEGTGDKSLRLVRRDPSSANEIFWDPIKGALETEQLHGLDAVIHLAGENIASGRWTSAKKERIRNSRVANTNFLCRQLGELSEPPKTLIAASAIGYYGDRGSELCDEGVPPGEGFLPEVCVDWEAATQPARNAGIRVVNLRIGVVLTPRGGALAKMLFPFKMGVGGRIGSGQQVWSWITLQDLVRVIRRCLEDENFVGAVNAVAPNPVSNNDFTKTLGRVLGRPTLFPMPAFMAKLALGDMAEWLLLASSQVVPTKLTKNNFEFLYPELEPALRKMLA